MMSIPTTLTIWARDIVQQARRACTRRTTGHQDLLERRCDDRSASKSRAKVAILLTHLDISILRVELSSCRLTLFNINDGTIVKCSLKTS